MASDFDPRQVLSAAAVVIVKAIQSGQMAHHQKENCRRLVDRLKMLLPLLEDIKQATIGNQLAAAATFERLEVAAQKAKDLLDRCGRQSSSLYMVTHANIILNQFHEVSSELLRCLTALPLVCLKSPESIRSQVAKINGEFRTVKYSIDTQTRRLGSEIELLVMENRKGVRVNQDILLRMASQLNLQSGDHLKAEQAVIEKAKSYARLKDDREEEGFLTQILSLLSCMEAEVCSEKNIERRSKMGEADKLRPPKEYCCPLSLELMADPVILASGQTFERVFIERWLEQGNTSCPLTKHVLSHTSLIPNFALRSSVASWCKAHGVPIPQAKKLPPNATIRGPGVVDFHSWLSDKNTEKAEGKSATLSLPSIDSRSNLKSKNSVSQGVSRRTVRSVRFISPTEDSIPEAAEEAAVEVPSKPAGIEECAEEEGSASAAEVSATAEQALEVPAEAVEAEVEGFDPAGTVAVLHTASPAEMEVVAPSEGLKVNTEPVGNVCYAAEKANMPSEKAEAFAEEEDKPADFEEEPYVVSEEQKKLIIADEASGSPTSQENTSPASGKSQGLQGSFSPASVLSDFSIAGSGTPPGEILPNHGAGNIGARSPAGSTDSLSMLRSSSESHLQESDLETSIMAENSILLRKSSYRSPESSADGPMPFMSFPSPTSSFSNGSSSVTESPARTFGPGSVPESPVRTFSGSSRGSSMEGSQREASLSVEKEHALTEADKLEMGDLASSLSSGSSQERHVAAIRVRQLAKTSEESRVWLGRQGCIKPLMDMLSVKETALVESSLFALLNLSISDRNKEEIVSRRGVPLLARLLKSQSEITKEACAGLVFSLSAMDEYKVAIGTSGAIPSLVDILVMGTKRAKSDVVSAAYNLSLAPTNKPLLVQAGIVKPLVYIARKGGAVFGQTMAEKAVAVLSNLAWIPEGQSGIVRAKGVPVLCHTVENGSEKGKEHAVACLLRLSVDNVVFKNLVYKEDVIAPLMLLSRFGSPRAKAKAKALLQQFNSHKQ